MSKFSKFMLKVEETPEGNMLKDLHDRDSAARVVIEYEGDMDYISDSIAAAMEDSTLAMIIMIACHKHLNKSVGDSLTFYQS